MSWKATKPTSHGRAHPPARGVRAEVVAAAADSEEIDHQHRAQRGEDGADQQQEALVGIAIGDHQTEQHRQHTDNDREHPAVGARAPRSAR